MLNNSNYLIIVWSNQTNTQFELTLTFNQKGAYSFYILIGLLVSIVGLIGNLLVMISILASKELRTNPTCILYALTLL